MIKKQSKPTTRHHQQKCICITGQLNEDNEVKLLSAAVSYGRNKEICFEECLRYEVMVAEFSNSCGSAKASQPGWETGWKFSADHWRKQLLHTTQVHSRMCLWGLTEGNRPYVCVTFRGMEKESSSLTALQASDITLLTVWQSGQHLDLDPLPFCPLNRNLGNLLISSSTSLSFRFLLSHIGHFANDGKFCKTKDQFPPICSSQFNIYSYSQHGKEDYIYVFFSVDLINIYVCIYVQLAVMVLS